MLWECHAAVRISIVSGITVRTDILLLCISDSVTFKEGNRNKFPFEAIALSLDIIIYILTYTIKDNRPGFQNL